MFQFFVIFHNKILDKCYENIPPDVLLKYFTFIAVNEDIQKIYTPNKYKVINEWELPNYGDMQKLSYKENSAIYNVYANGLHKPYSHIGFFQYDMIFNDNIVEYFERNVAENLYFAVQVNDFDFCAIATLNEPETVKFIIKDYIQYFKTMFDINGFFPLLNSYIIPVEKYEKIMGWVIQLYDKLYPWCIQPPNKTYPTNIAGIYERVMAFAIGNEHMNIMILNISHDETLRH